MVRNKKKTKNRSQNEKKKRTKKKNFREGNEKNLGLLLDEILDGCNLGARCRSVKIKVPAGITNSGFTFMLLSMAFLQFQIMCALP